MTDYELEIIRNILYDLNADVPLTKWEIELLTKLYNEYLKEKTK